MRSILLPLLTLVLSGVAVLPATAEDLLLSDPCGTLAPGDPEPLVLDSIDICTVDVDATYTESLELTLQVTAAADRTDVGEVFRVAFGAVECGYVEVRPGNVGNRAILRYTCDWDSFMTDPWFPADACLPVGRGCFGEPGDYVVLPEEAVESAGNQVTVTLRLHELLPHEFITVQPGGEIGVRGRSFLGDGPTRIEGDNKGGCTGGWCPSTRVGDETAHAFFTLPEAPEGWTPSATYAD